MRPVTRPESAGSRRGRRIAILLAILLLVGLPLYLWPLRGGIEGLPGAAALSGPPPDPRSAKAVAQLPADVWDGLMGRRAGSPSSLGGSKLPGNLTRIHPHEKGDGDEPLGFGSGGFFVPRSDPGSMPPVSGKLTDAGNGSGEGSSGSASGEPASTPWLGSGSSPSGGGSGGQGGEWSPFPGGVGPFRGGGGAGGGESFAPPTFVADPGPNDPPMPTPEPATLLLVGFNLAVVGAVAWRRLNRRQERKPSG